MNLTQVQQRAVEEIVNTYECKSHKIVQFTAPTGSGKTFMIANVISNILKENINNKIVFVILTLSDAELPKQFKNKLDDYQEFLDERFNVSHQESPSISKNKVKDSDYAIKWNNKDVIVFGTQSFGNKTIFTDRNIFKDFILELKENDYQIIYIRDEAHKGDKPPKEDKYNKKDQFFLEENSSFVIKMTATPQPIPNAKQVYISERSIVDEGKDSDKYLLKSSSSLNMGLGGNIIQDDNDILNIAIQQFKQIKQRYKEESIKNNYIINPAMLIQVDSDNQNGEKIEDNDHRIDEITKQLEENGLSWVIYFASRKESNLKDVQNKKEINLKNISKNNSSIDVVIFKVGPATGWDIPRACMLVQLRKVSSAFLSQQTVGRIKRNPNKNLEFNDLYDKYWIYSDHQAKTREVHKYVLEDKFKDIEIKSIRAINKNQLEEDYQLFISEILNEFLNSIKSKLIMKLKSEFNLHEKEVILKEDRLNTNDNFENKYIYQSTYHNALEIAKFISKVKKENSWILNIKKPILDLFNEIKNEVKIFDLNLNQMLFILFRDYLIEIDNKRKTFFTRKTRVYKIEKQKTKLPEYFVVYENKENEVDFKDIEAIYGYRNIILENNKKTTIQYLDSGPEEIYLKWLINNRLKDNIKEYEIFTKNPLQSPIYFEYWNAKKAQYAKAYIDFVLRFKNSKITFYIEVKGEKDYDPEKTKSIGKSFSDYKTSISNIDETMVLIIVKVNTDKKDFENVYTEILTKKKEYSNEKLYNTEELWELALKEKI